MSSPRPSGSAPSPHFLEVVRLVAAQLPEREPEPPAVPPAPPASPASPASPAPKLH